MDPQPRSADAAGGRCLPCSVSLLQVESLEGQAKSHRSQFAPEIVAAAIAADQPKIAIQSLLASSGKLRNEALYRAGNTDVPVWHDAVWSLNPRMHLHAMKLNLRVKGRAQSLQLTCICHCCLMGSAIGLALQHRKRAFPFGAPGAGP